MIGYNREEKQIEDKIQGLYREFALKYDAIQESEITESQKQFQIREAFEIATSDISILTNIRSFSDLSDEDRSYLGIKPEEDTRRVDTNVIDTLVELYTKRAKMPHRKVETIDVLKSVTLKEGEEFEAIDTTAFEEELRQYFTEHYYDLLSTDHNRFLSEAVELPDRVVGKKYGDITQMALNHNIDPNKFTCFGYQLTIQDGLVSIEDITTNKCQVVYASPEGINNRIFDLYSKTLYEEYSKNGRDFFTNDTRELKNNYITYAEKNGIPIEEPAVLETIGVDMAKVQGIAKYINRVVNDRDGVQKGDYTQSLVDDIIRNYSKIMNLQYYDFGDLESVTQIVGEDTYIDSLMLTIKEHAITREDNYQPNIAYGTPEFVREEYKKIMDQVRTLHQTNAFDTGHLDIEKLTRKKQAYRRYIQENGIDGIDTSIPKVEIDHDKTNMIADAIMSQYGEKCEDKENMRSRILAKLEDNWAEIVTETQVIELNKLFGAELKEMGCTFISEDLYIKDDFIYIGEYSGFNSKVIYATPEALRRNIGALDEKIACRRNSFDHAEERIREALEKYAQGHNFDMSMTSREGIERRRMQAREISPFASSINFWRTESMPDDPTARKKIKLEDTVFDIIDKMTEGVPQSLEGIRTLLKSGEDGVILLLGLDDMNIRGEQIDVAFSKLYNGDAKKFVQAVGKRDKKMVDFINQELATVGGEKAVTGMASFDRSKVPGKYRFTGLEVTQLKAQREARIEKEKMAIERMIANSPAKKKRANEKRREERDVAKAEYRAKLIAKGKRPIEDLDAELTELQGKEEQAKKLYGQYRAQLPEMDQDEDK